MINKSTEKRLDAILLETFGADYLELVKNDKVKHDQFIFNARLTCIKSIMGDMKTMGKLPESKTFDRLYDLDLYNLQQLEVEYKDMAHSFFNQKK